MTAPRLYRGDVVLTRFPFTDLTGDALRPAIVVSPGEIGQDVILVAVSSVLHDPNIATDYILHISHLEFASTGLRVTSVIRAHKLAALERSVVIRRLGRLGSQVQLEVDRRLHLVLGLQ